MIISSPKFALLTYSVFEQEIALHTHGAAHIVETRFFEMGSPDRPDLLRFHFAEKP